jgi:hypothetical protein
VEIGTATGEWLLGGINQCIVPPNTQVRNEARSGEPYSRLQNVVAQAPLPSWTSLAVAKALTAVPLLGKDISTLTTGLGIYAQKYAEGGTRAGASSHKKFLMVEGLIVPVTLSCEHGGDATIVQQAHITWDGSNDPIQVSEGVSLPAGIADDEAFGLGPLSIGGVDFEGVRSMEIAFNVEVAVEGADGYIWPTYAHIRTIKPVITWRGVDVQWLKDTGGVPLIGQFQDNDPTDDTIQYLRKRAQGGTYELNATAEHIKLTMEGLFVVDPALDASGDDPAECTLMCHCIYDGSNAPIKIDTASAIT